MADQADSAETATAISDALALAHIRYFGKGPSETQTFLTADYAFCVLTDPYTAVEQTLIGVSKRSSVRDRRQRFEQLMTKTFERTVSEISGRKVISFMGQTHVGPDLAVEIFGFEAVDGAASALPGQATAASASFGDEPVSAGISQTIAEIHDRYYGKKPSGANTFLQDGYAFCVLKDPFTPVEQTLIEIGKQSTVRDSRQAFQDAMSVKFRQAVEEITTKTAVAFMSQTHVGPDLAVEIFKLEDR